MNGLSGLTTFQPYIFSMLVQPSLATSIEPVNSSMLREIVRSAMLAPHMSIAALSKAVVSGVLANRSDLQTEIILFREKFQRHIELTKITGWIELKGQLDVKMMDKLESTECSLEEFRFSANSLINNITIELGKELGLPEPVVTECGTSGYKSDVDISIKIKENPQNLKDAVFYKTLRDCLHTFVLGKLSIFQLHTETFYQHPAEIDLSQYLHSPKAHRYFQTGEKGNVILQNCMGRQKSLCHFNERKLDDLNSISDAGEKEAMALLYDKVEALMDVLDGRIGEKLIEQYGLPREIAEDTKKHKLADEDSNASLAAKKEICGKYFVENLQAYKEARALVYVPIRIRLAERYSVVQQEIERDSKKYEDEARTFMQLSSQGLPVDKEVLVDLQQELDSLHLELQCILMIAASLQDEGTFSVAEGKATLLEEGGQIHARVLKERRNSMTGFLQGRPEVLDQFAKHPLFRRKSSHPAALTGTLRCQGNGISNDFARIILTKDVEEMLQPSFQRPTGQTFLMAAYEESMQLQHLFLEGLNGVSDPRMIVIESGKYAFRTTSRVYSGLMEFKKEQNTPKGLLSLLEKVGKLREKSESLEKCKRGVSISSVAAASLLTDEIIEGLTPRGCCDKIEIKAKVEAMFRNFDSGGIYYERVLPKEEHFRILRDTLRKVNGLFIEVDKARIIGILQAHAGILLNDIQIHVLKLKVGRLDDEQAKKFLSDLLESSENIDKHALKLALDSLNLPDATQLKKFLSDLVEHRKDLDRCAPQLTLGSLELTTEVQAKQFLSDILKAGAKARNMARSHGFLARSDGAMAHFFNLARTLQECLRDQ